MNAKTKTAIHECGRIDCPGGKAHPKAQCPGPKTTPKPVEDPGVDVGNAKVMHTGSSLYLLFEGGDFKHGGVAGHFGATAGGTALVVYIKDGGSYEVDIRDIIAVAVDHHKRTAKVPT